MKMLRSRKALSPVVASIILIAVTVAVSIAVAAWMGALTLGFTKTENIVLPDSAGIAWHPLTGFTTRGDYINMTIRNAATSLVTVTIVKVNGLSNYSSACSPQVPFSIQPNQPQDVGITFDWVAGGKYRIDFVTSNNNDFYEEYTAPST
jgi:flagellin-like protein